MNPHENRDHTVAQETIRHEKTKGSDISRPLLQTQETDTKRDVELVVT